ncbi:GntR family transcriptional regulator (plasmid) [Streptomyces sp. JL4002]|uniref:GntR family transcriptional regulator n=1 Tax=Streptomyces sp. JL4002 TaxID=3404781 RepID=UPI003B28B6B9
MPKITGVTPPFVQIATFYRDRIKTGELKAGDRFPPARVIADDWGVSRATADKALGILRNERLIKSAPGIGSEVLPAAVSLVTGEDRLVLARSGATFRRPGETTGGHRAELVPAPEDVASILGLALGAPVIRRSRIFSDATGVSSFSTSWIPGDLASEAPELLKPQRLGKLSVEIVEEITGRRAVARVNGIHPKLASKSELAVFGYPSDSVHPVLAISTQFMDENGGAIEYGVDIGAPGRGITERVEISR